MGWHSASGVLRCIVVAFTGTIFRQGGIVARSKPERALAFPDKQSRSIEPMVLRGSACVQVVLHARVYNVDRPVHDCLHISNVAATRSVEGKSRRARRLVWLTGFMGSTYRVLTALYINNDTRTRGRSLPLSPLFPRTPTGPFYDFPSVVVTPSALSLTLLRWNLPRVNRRQVGAHDIAGCEKAIYSVLRYSRFLK